mmetsp:Transcript_29612/g.65222  ORF Transcript_29612/g.65222 Transcript_29612/m.65222 type:complete len:439 (-) Transcript_29612:11-1327(-)
MKRRAASAPSKALDVSVAHSSSASAAQTLERPQTKGLRHYQIACSASAAGCIVILVVLITSPRPFGSFRHDSSGNDSQQFRAANSVSRSTNGDMFIAVTTSHNANQQRISSILDTWWNFAPHDIAFFTDDSSNGAQVGSAVSPNREPWPTRSMSDPLLSDPTRDSFNLINTGCESGHTPQGLCCKTAANIRYYHDHSKASWLCHADDDSFVVYPSLRSYLSELDPSKDHFIGRAGATLPVGKKENNKGAIRKSSLLQASRKKLQPDSTSGKISEYFAIGGGAGWCVSRPVVERGIKLLASLPQTCIEINFSDDTALGYVLQVKLGVTMVNENMLHSHLDEQAFESRDDAMRQLTFGSGPGTKRWGASIPSQVNSSALNDDFNFVSYPGSPSFGGGGDMHPGRDPLGFRALYCDFWPEECQHSKGDDEVAAWISRIWHI